MENASKALLIAGGVLIAMLVASLGIYFSRNFANDTSKIYKQLEEPQITGFNQQFLNYDKRNDLNIQDIVTIVNLAKNSNKNNYLKDSDAPTNPTEDNNSLYITVDFNNRDYSLGDLETSFRRNLQKLSDSNINILIKDEMQKANVAQFSCNVHINSNTGYVNYVEIK